ncbi:hypothetical protein NDR87_09860 [Nocardia sp. CDC159]|uniref:Uncharacterized protein n=1 Tax=Nocardia pulmonis TaxID=2951408 RepID=A0A9X2E938_9NOCA|nr:MULTISPECIES: hypothetical protein [Nocardia]MCM6773773.1 hypothetical protein [Nocardia pulmonis]MCM6786660.1 hypothetical protein [Nocardia sp. CDC159]
MGMGTFAVIHFAALAVSAAVLLWLLWPSERSGPRLLRRWGVPDPTEEQGRIVRTYLRNRRVLYVVFLVLPGYWFGGLCWILIALLLAELIAMIRPVRGRFRVATLTRRSIGDMLPTWMIAVHLTAVALAVCGVLLTSAAETSATGPATAGEPWISVAAAVGSTGVVYAVAWLAIARPAMGDVAVDTALRLRSARVMTGLGTMAAATLLADALWGLANLRRSGKEMPDWVAWIGPQAIPFALVTLLLGLVAWWFMVRVRVLRTGADSKRTVCHD